MQKLLLPGFLVLMLMGGLTATFGQSGRRTVPQPVGVPSVMPVRPSATPASTPRPAPAVDWSIAGAGPPRMLIKVMADVWPGMRLKLDTPGRMQAWMIDRLDDSILLDVRSLGQGSRGDAVKAAKAETDAPVVLVQLEDGPSTAAITAGHPADGDVWINLTVLTAVTAREKLSRRILLHKTPSLAADLTAIITKCHPGILGNDLLLLQASVEAAEQVMSAFQIPIPSECR